MYNFKDNNYCIKKFLPKNNLPTALLIIFTLYFAVSKDHKRQIVASTVINNQNYFILTMCRQTTNDLCFRENVSCSQQPYQTERCDVVSGILIPGPLQGATSWCVNIQDRCTRTAIPNDRESKSDCCLNDRRSVRHVYMVARNISREYKTTVAAYREQIALHVNGIG